MQHPTKLVYYVAVTLDGRIAHSDGTYQGFSESGEHVEDFNTAIEDSSAVLMGRKTYDVGLAAGLPLGQPAYRGRPNYVFSNTLHLPKDNTAHGDFELVSEDAATFVAALKRTLSGTLWLCGGGELASALVNAGLVDEVVLKINPVIFGQGRPLVAGLDRRWHAALVESQTHANGVITARYSLDISSP